MSGSIASSTFAQAIRRAGVLAGALIALGTASAAFAAAPAFLGNWARDDGKTRIRVEPCGAEFCGVNTWVKSGHTGEKLGDTLVAKLKPAGSERWSGSAFDRRRDRHYTMRVHVEGKRMTTDGCMLGGMVCQSMSWTRVGAK